MGCGGQRRLVWSIKNDGMVAHRTTMVDGFPMENGEFAGPRTSTVAATNRTPTVDESRMDTRKFAGPRTSTVVTTDRRRTGGLWASMVVATCHRATPSTGRAEGAGRCGDYNGKERRGRRSQRIARRSRLSNGKKRRRWRTRAYHNSMARRIWSWIQQRTQRWISARGS